MTNADSLPISPRGLDLLDRDPGNEFAFLPPKCGRLTGAH